MVRLRGRLSWRGRSKEVNLDVYEGDFGRKASGEVTSGVRSAGVEGTVAEREIVVSITGDGEEPIAILREARTASRICSRAAGRSWK